MGYIGSKIGKELGGLLYDENSDAFDSFIAEIRDFIPTGESIDASDYIDRLIDHAFSALTPESSEIDNSNDILVFTEPEEAFGGDGDDILIGWKSGFIAAGEPIEPDDPDSEVAETDIRLTRDGGKGDDWLISFGGRGAILVGGEGKDWLFNTSERGQLYGDTIDGLDGEGNPLNKLKDLPDDLKGYNDRGGDNTDIFWFWPGTFIMDAGREDHISYFGLPITGGTNLPVMGSSLFSIMSFLAATAQSAIAMDWINPNIFYAQTGSKQLLIFDRVSARLGIGPDDMKGMMVVEDYDFGTQRNAEWNLRELRAANDNCCEFFEAA